MDCFTCLWLEVELLGMFSIQNLLGLGALLNGNSFCIPYIKGSVQMRKSVQKVVDLWTFFSSRTAAIEGFRLTFCRLFFIKIPLQLTPAKLKEDTGYRAMNA
jgi:hypothetical protein